MKFLLLNLLNFYIWIYSDLLEFRAATREHESLAGRRSIARWEGSLQDYDAVLIATDHDAVDYAAVAGEARLVVDTRNACARAGASGAHIVKA